MRTLASRPPITARRIISVFACLLGSICLACGQSASPTVASFHGAPSPTHFVDLRAYNECMAKHGVETRSDGSVASAVPPPNYHEAVAACARLAPVVESQDNPVPPDLIKHLLNYSRCMRAHGVDVPDPVIQYGMAVVAVPEDVYNTDRYQAADKVCRVALQPSPTAANG